MLIGTYGYIKECDPGAALQNQIVLLMKRLSLNLSLNRYSESSNYDLQPVPSNRT